MNQGKAIIFSAPSGSGKTTIVNHLLRKFPDLGFSISATTRVRRLSETDGQDYYFLSQEDFEKKITQQEFVEWEQVYKGLYYGTLKKEVERIWSTGRHVLFDVDVVGGMNLKKYFGSAGLSVFVKVPDLKVLKERLEARNTESPESLARRLEKVEYEWKFEDRFDCTLINDRLEDALRQSEKIVAEFLEK